MAICARHTTLQMGGAAIIALVVAALMAIQATCANFRGRCVLECKDFCFVAAAVDVGLAWAVTSFTTVPLGPFVGVKFRVHRRGKVRCGRKTVVNFFVTGFARFRAYVERRISLADVFLRFIRRLGFIFAGFRTGLFRASNRNREAHNEQN